MMKKITLLLIFLITSFGFAQTSNYCSTEVTHLNSTDPAFAATAMNLTIVNTGATTMKVTAADVDISFLALEGSITGAPIKTAMDTSVAGEISITLTWAPAAPVDVNFQFIQWEITGVAGRHQIENATTPSAGTCAPPIAPEADASLSDLLVDGITITGFSSITLDYNVFLPNGTITVPTITATTTHGLASPVITQAPSLPGSATVVVTSEDTFNQQTYTVSFGFQGPDSAAPVPTQAQAEVISVFSQITNDFADPVPAITSHYTDIANTNYNPNWGSNSGNVVLESLAGDVVLKYPNLDYQGTVLGSQTDVGDMEFLHIDFWTDAGTTLAVSVISVTTGEEAYDIAGALGSLPQGQWKGIDVPLSYLTDANANFDFNIKELKFSLGGFNTLYLDNIYFWKPFVDPLADATLSDLKIDGTTVSGFSANTTDYAVVLPKGTTAVPTITVTTTNGPAEAVITPASGLPGSTTVVVTSEDSSTQKTYTVSFTVDTNTPCAGTSTGALQGSFTLGYNYSFVTSGNDVTITFEMLDSYTGLVGQLHQGGANFSNMTSSDGGVTWEITLAGQTIATDLTFSFFGANAGPTIETSEYTYTVGDNCGTLGVNDFEKASFQTFPNPTQDSWTVKTKSENISSIRVFDILGKSVLSLAPNSNEATIDGSGLKTGLYFAQIETANGLSSLKLVKQ